MKIISKVSKKRNGGIGIEFSYTETYRILREELNFRYTTVESKKEFIRKENGVNRVVQFNELKKAFRDYLEANFHSLDIPDSITLDILINATYIKTPINITNNTLRRELE